MTISRTMPTLLLLLVSVPAQGQYRCYTPCDNFLIRGERAFLDGERGCDKCTCESGQFVECETLPAGTDGCATDRPCSSDYAPWCYQYSMCTPWKPCKAGESCYKSAGNSKGCCRPVIALKIGDTCSSPPYWDRKDECPSGSSCVRHLQGGLEVFTCTQNDNICLGGQRCDLSGGLAAAKSQCPKTQVCAVNDACISSSCVSTGCCQQYLCADKNCADGPCTIVNGEATCLRGCRTKCNVQVSHGWSGHNDGSESCNACTCHDGEFTCTHYDCSSATSVSCDGCLTDFTCPSGTFCVDAELSPGVCTHSHRVCRPRSKLGEKCGGILPCEQRKCDTGLMCAKAVENHAENTEQVGTCVPSGSCECMDEPTCPPGMTETPECSNEQIEAEACIREQKCCKTISCKLALFCDDRPTCNDLTPCSSGNICINAPDRPCRTSRDCPRCCVPDACEANPCEAGLKCITTYDGHLCVPNICEGKEACGSRAQAAGCGVGKVCLDDPADVCDPKKDRGCPSCCLDDPCFNYDQCPDGTTCHVDAYGSRSCLKSCTTSCGRVVVHGVSRRDEGPNNCKQCKCIDGDFQCSDDTCTSADICPAS